MTALEGKFLSALKLTESGKAQEALEQFNQIIAEDPQGDLADDALFNIGLLFFGQEQFDKAEDSFKRVISDYPDSTIAEFDNSAEHGATPAKAYLGLINCYLAMGREVDAWEAFDKLGGYSDSYVVVVEPSGAIRNKSFKELGQELLDRYAAAKQELESMEA